MIYLILAIISSASISIIMRISEKYVKNELCMFMSNYAVCMMLSMLFIKDIGAFQSVGPKGVTITIVLALFSGVMYLANFLFYKYNMKHNGIVMSATFMKLGVLVPTIMAVVLFREIPKSTQVIGIVVAIAAIVLIHFEKNALSESKHMIGLLLLLLLSGLTDAMASVFEKMGEASMKDIYLLITFGTAFVITVVLIVSGKIKLGGKELLFGALIGIPNYFSSRFLILALEQMEAVFVYPTYSVATMVTIMMVGIFAFHEKISKKKLCALGMILAALVLLNL